MESIDRTEGTSRACSSEGGGFSQQNEDARTADNGGVGRPATNDGAKPPQEAECATTRQTVDARRKTLMDRTLREHDGQLAVYD